MAKADSPDAIGCCKIRSTECQTDPAEEPARTNKRAPLGPTVVQATQQRPSNQDPCKGVRNVFSISTEAPDRDLYLKHSILLV